MSLYARSDLMSVSIPPASGGCGHTHSRPVDKGVAARNWRLDCQPCEDYLRGAGKPKLLKTTPGDPKLGIPAKQERVADADPHWGSTPESVPLTPDEHASNAVREQRGRQQIELIQALAALRASGINVPPEAAWLLDRELPASLVKGTIVCPNGHDNAAGGKFCAECSAPMNSRAAIEAPEDEASPLSALPLGTLHIATLRKMCRERGVDDKGNKEALIGRLTGAL